MKNSAMTFTALGAVLMGLSASVNASVFREPAVTPQQYQSIHSGESAHEVVAQLGRPEFRPHWTDGTYSLTYRTEPMEGFEPAQLFVNIDAKTHKVIDYSVNDDIL